MTEPMTEPLLTYAEWNAQGLRIHKGSKARGFRNGEALFARIDTYDPNFEPKMAYFPELGEWDDHPH